MEEALRELGLSNKEATLYMLLLSHPRQTAQELANRSAITRTNVYRLLDLMEARGLVTFEDNPIRRYCTAEPQALQKLLRDQQQHLQQAANTLSSAMPRFRAQYALSLDKPGVFHMAGAEGFERLLLDMISSKTEVLLVASNEVPTDQMTLSRFRELLADRKHAGVHTRALFHDGAHHERIHQEFYERGIDTRFVGDTPFDGEVVMYEDTVAFTVYKPSLVVTVLTNTPIAHTMRLLFEQVWASAKTYAVDTTTVDQWLTASVPRLSDHGITSARLDCLLLLEHVIRTDRAHILAHTDQILTDQELGELEGLLVQRLDDTPMAYILGQCEFYGRKFSVSKHVLVPRPESEAICSLLATIKKPDTIIDIGTGSGALAITAKLLHPNAVVYATDIDPKCLELANQNACTHHAQVEFIQGDLLEPVPSTASKARSIIIANLPYVPTDYPVNAAAAQEPKIALYGGEDGLDLYRTLWDQITKLPKRPAAIICESLPEQHKTLAKIATKAGYKLQTSDGLAQVFVPKA